MDSISKIYKESDFFYLLKHGNMDIAFKFISVESKNFKI